MTYFDSDNIPYDYMYEEYDCTPYEMCEPILEDSYFWSDEDWFEIIYGIYI